MAFKYILLSNNILIISKYFLGTLNRIIIFELNFIENTCLIIFCYNSTLSPIDIKTIKKLSKLNEIILLHIWLQVYNIREHYNRKDYYQEK